MGQNKTFLNSFTNSFCEMIVITIEIKLNVRAVTMKQFLTDRKMLTESNQCVLTVLKGVNIQLFSVTKV